MREIVSLTLSLTKYSKLIFAYTRKKVILIKDNDIKTSIFWLPDMA